MSMNMSNTLLAYAKLEHQPGHLMGVMVAEALRKLDTFTPQVYFHETCVCASPAIPGHQPKHRQTHLKPEKLAFN